MNKKILIVVGITILFLGVGIQPAIAVTTNTSDIDDNCNLCPKVKKHNIVRLKSLLNRLDQYDNQLSALSKKYPEVAEKSQELSERITTIKEMNTKLNSITDWETTPALCLILIIIWGVSFGLAGFFLILSNIFASLRINILMYMFGFLAIFFIDLFGISYVLAKSLGCIPDYSLTNNLSDNL